MFKKFLTERTMEIKFLFLVDDLRWLNEIILTECSIIPCKNKFVKTTPLFLKKRCLFQYSKSLIKSWLKKTLSLKNNFYTNLSATQSNNKPYISRLKAHLFKFSKVYCNEAFVFFISTFFFTKEKNERMELSSVIFKNCECYIKKFEFYRLFSVVD